MNEAGNTNTRAITIELVFPEFIATQTVVSAILLAARKLADNSHVRILTNHVIKGDN